MPLYHKRAVQHLRAGEAPIGAKSSGVVSKTVSERAVTGAEPTPAAQSALRQNLFGDWNNPVMRKIAQGYEHMAEQTEQRVAPSVALPLNAEPEPGAAKVQCRRLDPSDPAASFTAR